MDQADAAQFSIATYNILADCYVRISEQPWNAFAHCRDEDIRYEDRQTKITKQLLDIKADLVCLQEVMLEKRTCKENGDDLWSLPAWTDTLSESGYVGIMQGLSQKEWEKNSQRNHRMVGKPIPTGVASFYRSEIWEEIEPAKHGTGSGTVLFLRKRNCPSLQIAVGNTHLVGDPQKAEAHLRQLSGLQKNMAKCPQCVRLICGDMNGDCAHDSDVGSWIKEQGLEDLSLGSATWAEPGRGLHLDHVFFDGGALAPLSARAAMSEEDVAQGMPNSRCPSDHALVSAVFALRDAPAAHAAAAPSSTAPPSECAATAPP